MNKLRSIDNINKITSLEYIVMFLLLCISGNPLFVYTTEYVYIISTIFIFVVCLFKNKLLINRKFAFWFISSCLLFMFQYVSLEYTSIAADINFIARLYVAFLVTSLLGYKFRKVYLKVIVFICAISLIFYTLGLVIGGGFGPQVNRYNTILIYNSVVGNITRNSGMFWEPGAFQGYIMIVFLLYSDNLTLLWKNNRVGCVVMLLALLTTQSTTGYISFTIFIVLTLIVNRRLNMLYKVILAVVCIIVISYVWNLDFITDKIIKEYDSAMEIESGDVSWSRFGSMMIDIENIARHPVIGNGFMNQSRYGILGEYMTGMGNGFSGAVNMFGIPFIVIFFMYMYKNLSNIKQVNRIIFLIIIALLLFGEYFLNYPFFWSLLFIKVPNHEKNSSITYSS